MRFNADTNDKNDILNVLHFIAGRIGDPDDAETLRVLWDEMLCFLTTDQLREFAEHMRQTHPQTRRIPE